MCRVYSSSDYNYYEKSTLSSDAIFISNHAYKRLKQRLGWNKHASKRMIKKIYDAGTRNTDIHGYTSIWLNNTHRKHFEHCEEIIVFGNHIFLFKQKTLVTVLNIPCRIECLKYAS